MRKCSFLNHFDSADAMKLPAQAQATTRKLAQQIVSAKATLRTRPFDPSKPRQKKSGGHIQTAAWKLSILPEQEF